jgi:hypothetical protein
MPIGPLLIPTLTFYAMEKRKLIPKNRFLKMSVETLVFLAALTFAPPMATAIFPQTAAAKVSKLEKEFRNLKDECGNPITELFYNKGL